MQLSLPEAKITLTIPKEGEYLELDMDGSIRSIPKYSESMNIFGGKVFVNENNTLSLVGKSIIHQGNKLYVFEKDINIGKQHRIPTSKASEVITL